MRRLHVLFILILLILLGSCSGKNDGNTADNDTGRREIIDGFGRNVSLMQEIDSIAAVGGAARILTYAGCSDLLVGVCEMDKRNNSAMPYSVVNAERYATLPSVGSGGSKNSIYYEQLVELNPDLIIAVSDRKTVETIARKTGIPTIGLYPRSMFDQSFFDSLAIIGEASGRREHSQRVVDYIKECREDLKERGAQVPEDERPGVYTGAVSYRGARGFGGSYGEYPPFDAIGARNLVDETGKSGAVTIDPEQLLEWDPDIIFLNPTNMNLVREEYRKRPELYRSLTAVQQGRVYSQISYNYNWTNMEIAIADAYYAGSVIFPGAFADIDPVEKADEIFRVMLGQPFYNELEADGMRFAEIRLEEPGEQVEKR